MAFDCRQDLWNYIEDRFDVNISELNIVRHGDIVKLLRDPKVKVLDISRILIEAGKKKQNYHNHVRKAVEKVDKVFRYKFKRSQVQT